MVSFKLKRSKVYLTYFFSYMLILIFSLSVLFSVIHFDFKARFNAFIQNDQQQKLEHLTDLLSNEFLSMYHIYNSVKENDPLLRDSYRTDAFRAYLMQNELAKYLHTSSLLSDIVYLDLAQDQIFSAHYGYTRSGDKLFLHYNNNEPAAISMEQIDFSQASLYYYPNASTSFLFFVPEQNSSNCRILFLIDQIELSSLLSTIATIQTIDISLLNHDDSFSFSAYPLTDSESFNSKNQQVLTAACYYPAFSLLCVQDNHLINLRINQSFHTAYLILASFFLVGVVLIIAVTNHFYAPRKVLARFLSKSDPYSTGNINDYLDFKQMEQVFTSIQDENALLLQKVHNYQVNIEKTLLQSSLPCSTLSTDHLDVIENMFTQKRQLVVIHLSGCHSSCTTLVHDALAVQFGSDLSVFSIDSSEDSPAFLIVLPFTNYADGHNSCEEIQEKIKTAFLSSPYPIYISEVSDNPLHISRLYEEVLLYSRTDKGDSIFALVDEFETNILNKSYPDAIVLLDTIFKKLPTSHSQYFIQSILLTLLNHIVQGFIGENIPFSYYSDEYYDALYWSRSKELMQSFSSIQETYQELMSFFINQPSFDKLTPEKFSEYFNKEFCSSSFSINQLGDHFQVSSSYISYWFKKTYNQNLSDYLWTLRFERSLKLMQDPSLNMNDIASAVGYDNYSSFRRKFKSHCGISPSEYRKSHFNLS